MRYPSSRLKLHCQISEKSQIRIFHWIFLLKMAKITKESDLKVFDYEIQRKHTKTTIGQVHISIGKGFTSYLRIQLFLKG